MTAAEVIPAWRGSVLRLPGGQVLLTGPALLDVIEALQAAQRVVERCDRIGAPERWRWLIAQMQAAAADAPAAAPTAAPRPAAVPPRPAAVLQAEASSDSLQDDDTIGSEEAAAMLGCRPRNVRDLAARGVLSSRKHAGRLLLERSEIEAEARRRAAVAVLTRGGGRGGEPR